MLVLSRPEYSELALECWQKVKSRNYFAQVSNSTTKFLSVYLVVSTFRNCMSFCFLYASLKSIIQKSAMPTSALLLESCYYVMEKKLFDISTNIIYRNLWYCLYIPPKDSARFYQTGVLLARNFRTSCQLRISRFWAYFSAIV